MVAVSRSLGTALSARPSVVIVGFELNGLGVARALAEHGVECIGVAGPSPHPAWKTNTCKVVPCKEWSQDAVLQTLTAIGERQKRKSPLLITKEAAVRWISNAREKLADFYEMCLPEKPVVDRLLNKATFARLCVEAGWPIPHTWRIRSHEELLSVLVEVPFPCILKPEVSSEYFGERSPRKAFKLSNADELVRIYRMAAQWAQGFVVQEWVHGGDERIAICLTYVGRDGTPQAFFVGRKLRQFPPDCGNTALCEPAPPSWREPICALTETIWRSVGFKGLGAIEYKVRMDSGQPVIIEPCIGRPMYPHEVAVLNGVNIPLVAYCDLAGLPTPSLPASSRPCKLVDGVREFRAARHYVHNGTLTYRKWLRDRRGRCRYMTFRANDLGPFLASLRSGLKPLTGRLVERFFGRAAKKRLKDAIQSVGALERRNGKPEWRYVSHGSLATSPHASKWHNHEGLTSGLGLPTSQAMVAFCAPSLWYRFCKASARPIGNDMDGAHTTWGPTGFKAFRAAMKAVHETVNYLRLPHPAKAELQADRAGLPKNGPGIQHAVEETVGWLCRAQDYSRSRDGGVARHFSLVDGWGTSYPETTGYIIPTLLAYARTYRDEKVRRRVKRMLEWLNAIQFPDGSFQGGPVGDSPLVPVSFNTGQILLGLAAGVREFGNYQESLIQAADWLVAIQDRDGAWRKHSSPFVAPGEKTYDTHTAWGLLEAARIAPHKPYMEAALANVRWALSFQQENGWIDNCCLSDTSQPLTHALGYVLRGTIEAYRFSGEPMFLDASLKTANGLLSALRDDGFLPGRLDLNWNATVPWVCLPGTAQISICWLLLYQMTGLSQYLEAGAAANRYLRRTLKIDAQPETKGGVKASFPIDSPYNPYQFVAWAAKFFIDTNMLEDEVRDWGETGS